MKIQLTNAIHFFFSKDSEEELVMHSRSSSIKFTSYNDANKVVDELFKSLCSIYHRYLQTAMWGSDLIFDSVHLMYYKCHNVNFQHTGSHIDSPDWIKKKKATVNPKKMKMINILNTR